MQKRKLRAQSVFYVIELCMALRFLGSSKGLLKGGLGWPGVLYSKGTSRSCDLINKVDLSLRLNFKT